ncbi:glycosyltransferase [Acinetobacter higginsii]|uniref:glycosyltransferase n=1 Tax=Acinetobacter higginsii TaxID=70347 RepID=UPI001F4A8EB5|nr:glycosyltransferase [Acinetobacter higginsii]MCH7339002.1 glycosyltransferase [Acinetobacter higginsii]
MNQKKTILVLASTYPRWPSDPEPGFIHELCKKLTLTFNVIALVPDSVEADPDGLFEDVSIIRYRYAPKKLQSLVNNGGIVNNLKMYWWKWLLVPGFLIGQYLAIRKILRSNSEIDLIHAHWLIPQGFLAHSFSKRFNIPFVVTSHGGDLYGLQGKFLTHLKKQIAESADAMTVVSHAMQDYLKQQNIYPVNLNTIPMGVDLHNRFTPNSQINRESNHLLFVGRLVPKKGVHLLLEALPLILKQKPGIRLSIIGFGPEEQNLKNKVHELKIDNHVIFLGGLSQAQLPEFYRKATLFVAPFTRATNGDQEGLPVSLMEAIGCGCPAVVGDVPGIEDLLGTDIKDMVVDSQNIEQLASTILFTLNNIDLANQRAMYIRENALNFVDWHSVGQAYTNVLTNSLNDFKKI